MSRTCSTCQHLKRAEIDHRLAAGEPGEQIDSLSRLAATSEADVIAPVPDPMDLDGLVERILQRFDREPDPICPAWVGHSESFFEIPRPVVNEKLNLMW